MKLKSDSIPMRNHPSMRDSSSDASKSNAANTHVGNHADNACPLRKWLARSVLAATLCCSFANDRLYGQGAGTSVDDEGVVHWPRLDFVIPFNVDVTGQAPREIQLEYSDDGGASWMLYSRSDVRTKQFQFQASQDGEYRFRLKTLDSRGRSFDNPGDPLRVVVDTAKPTAELIVDIDARGVMLAEFAVRDSAVDISSIQLSYFTDTMTQSSEIEFELNPGRTRDEWIGTGTWGIPEGTKMLSVRLTAKDKAGNVVEVTRLPKLPRSASLNNGLQLASGRTRDNAGARTSNAKPIGSGTIGTGTIGSGIVETPADALPKVQILSGPGSRSAAGIDPKFATQLMERQQELIEQQKNLINHQQSANNLLAMEGRSRATIGVGAGAGAAPRGNEDLSPEEFNSMGFSGRNEAPNGGNRIAPNIDS
jgi:hypothetical protein